MKNYTDIIRELREDRDLSQRQIANLLGTTQQVYSRYEKGENELPIRHLITLCLFYEVSADYILCIGNNTFKQEKKSFRN
ncbi:MAG: helix-turn-helix transcriptional regulator [Oscillospiraceae bacterium]|nr:helix-turn-helix transcriptional regulator [Oscillospiraceae bacterium]